MYNKKDIENKANNILKNLDFNIPVRVEEIAKQFNIEIKKGQSKEFSGVLYRKDGIAFMALNSSESEVRQRFTIAHELGHFFLHEQSNTFVDYRDTLESSSTKNQKEREADQFAAALLMPEKKLLEDVSKFDLIEEEEIKILSDKYKVSKPAMTYRLINLKLLYI